MSRWYFPPPKRPKLSDLDLPRIAGLEASATSDAAIASEFFSLTEYGRQHGAVQSWFAPAATGMKGMAGIH